MAVPPLVSVLMPAYNVESYIEESIASVVAQTYPNWELLILEDCSTDATLSVIQRHVTEHPDPRIRLIQNTHNLKLVGTLNKGIAEAKGTYISRLDSDDIALPTRFAEQVAAFTTDPNIGVVASWTLIIDAHGRIIDRGNWQFSPEAIYVSTFFHNCITHSSVMVDLNLIRSLGGYHDVIAEDYDLWSRVSLERKIVQLPRFLVKYRIHAKSLMSTITASNADSANQISQTNLKNLTGITYPSDLLPAFRTWNNLCQSSPSQIKTAAETFPRCMAAIVAHTPACYDKAQVIDYAGVELVQYFYFFKRLGYRMPFPGDIPLSLSVRLRGYLHYRSHFRPSSALHWLLPKNHF